MVLSLVVTSAESCISAGVGDETANRALNMPRKQQVRMLIDSIIGERID